MSQENRYTWNDEFITHFVEKYIEKHPLDGAGNIHVRMVRLEVEAIN